MRAALGPPQNPSAAAAIASRTGYAHFVALERWLTQVAGNWFLAQCGPHAQGRELLREAAPWPSPRARGQGPSRTLPEEIHGQEPLSKA